MTPKLVNKAFSVKSTNHAIRNLITLHFGLSNDVHYRNPAAHAPMVNYVPSAPINFFVMFVCNKGADTLSRKNCLETTT